MGLCSKWVIFKKINNWEKIIRKKIKINKRIKWTNTKEKRIIALELTVNVKKEWRDEKRYGTTKINIESIDIKKSTLIRGIKIKKVNLKR